MVTSLNFGKICLRTFYIIKNIFWQDSRDDVLKFYFIFLTGKNDKKLQKWQKKGKLENLNFFDLLYSTTSTPEAMTFLWSTPVATPQSPSQDIRRPPSHRCSCTKLESCPRMSASTAASESWALQLCLTNEWPISIKLFTDW